MFVLRIEDTDPARTREERSPGPGHPAVARSRLGRRARCARAIAASCYAAAVDQLLAEGHAYKCFCTEDELRARNECGARGRQRPGIRRPLPRPHARRARRARGGRPGGVVRFRTPDDGVSRVPRPGPGRGRGRLVAHPRLRDPAIRRLADLLPGQRGRRHRHGDHARHPRRGPDRHDPPRARARARRSAAASHRCTHICP